MEEAHAELLLSKAVADGDIRGVERSIMDGVDVNAPNRGNLLGIPILTLAVTVNNSEIAKTLLAAGANLETRFGVRTLPRSLQACVYFNFNFNFNPAPQPNDETALMVAAVRGGFECVDVLIKANAKLNTQDKVRCCCQPPRWLLLL